MQQYLYNMNTGTLHIKGFCCNSNFKCIPDNNKCFDTEQESYKYTWQKPCNLFEKKKEKDQKE